MPVPTAESRRVALITGVGRRAGIGACVAEHLLHDGFDVAITAWGPYDERMSWGPDAETASSVVSEAVAVGARCVAIEADLEEPTSIPRLFDQVEAALAAVDVLVMCHAESVATDLLSTTIESFDRHFAINARASWLLVREFALRCTSPFGTPRIIAMTSDATLGNLPYGASKAALDRITLAAAKELAYLGVTANVINPGPTDTGWMSVALKEQIERQTPLARLGLPRDAAHLVSFLCSPEGAWLNGQLITSNGGVGSG